MTTAGKAAGSTPEDELLEHRTGRSPTLRQNGTPPATMPTPDWPGSRTGCRSAPRPGRSIQRQCRRHCNEQPTPTPSRFLPAQPAGLGPDADQAAIELYSLHYRPLVRLAALLVRDVADCRGSGAGRVYRHA